MQGIQLQTNNPNFEFTVTLEQNKYDIAIRTIGDRTYMSVDCNGADVIDGVLCVPGAIVLPYAYLEGQGGNFVWVTANDNYPNWNNFGTTDFLLYISVAELASLRNGTAT